MPPKKRNRDGEPEGPDPDQLDKDELKAMLRDSIDREAQLTSQLEEQKKQAEAEKEGRVKRDEESKLERLFLYYCDRSTNFHGHAAVVYYPNFNVVQQAEASGMEHLLDIAQCLSTPGLTWDHSVYHLAVGTCTELVDIFENGVKAGSKLCEDSQEDSLFSIVLVSEADDLTVLPGTEDQYLVIAARSSAQRYNVLLARYLSRSTDLGPNFDEYRFLANNKTQDTDYMYEDAIHDRLRALGETEFNTVLKNVWVPEAPSEDRKNRKFEVELDLDRMVEVTVGNMEEATIGFWFVVRDDESDEEGDEDD